MSDRLAAAAPYEVLTRNPQNMTEGIANHRRHFVSGPIWLKAAFAQDQARKALKPYKVDAKGKGQIDMYFAVRSRQM